MESQVCVAAGKRRNVAAAIWAAVVAFTPVGAHAQEPTVRAGARVRAVHRCAERALNTGPERWCSLVGEFVQTQPGNVLIRAGDSVGRYPLESLRRFEVSQGTGSYRLVGAAVGGVLGATASYLVLHSGGSTSPCDRSANQDAMNAGECVGLVAVGGAAGVGAGLLIGGLIRSERWREIAVERLRVGLMPHGVLSIRVKS